MAIRAGYLPMLTKSCGECTPIARVLVLKQFVQRPCHLIASLTCRYAHYRPALSSGWQRANNYKA